MPSKNPSTSAGELLSSVAQTTGQTKATVKQIVDAFLEQVQQHLEQGERVQINNFGTLEVRTRKERQGVNPQTRQHVTIPASNGVGFKPSAALSLRVNPNKSKD